MKTKDEIKKALPNIKSEKVDVISDELDRILEIKKLFQSAGGKQLITLLRNNCASALRKAVIAAKKGEDKELVALVLDYSANMDLISTVRDISLEKEMREQLDEAVKEAYEE